MPRVVTDDELLAEVLAFEKTVGSRSKLAIKLGIDRSTFWRFCRTGRAIDKTREAIREGLMRNKNETNGNFGKVKTSIENTFVDNIREDMQSLRSLCTTVLTVLDGYEKLLANGTANK
ncbi:hypothetical protein [Methylotenera sp.]|uniref:hypothetical protein n=1 Tax=Methylotenera sp. TaxID=2051956 RepID=UPI002727695F|nr:hypothetical protein [Methylotenera sp.]MDO9204147.1 hypothetical protein [Methylotenera sp.]MDP1522344.1 hypothetical protein [Methylotenera sp.]MDP2072582.1 hypothetical protein [Methylotenera sp.]MDP3006051.1 hypothetical protein [Methylotenera sp.]MDP3819164.1 hypothetical protein [Methylotenera sp.]